MSLPYFYRKHMMQTNYTHFTQQYIHLQIKQSPHHNEFPSNRHTHNTPHLNQINHNTIQ